MIVQESKRLKKDIKIENIPKSVENMEAETRFSNVKLLNRIIRTLRNGLKRSRKFIFETKRTAFKNVNTMPVINKIIRSIFTFLNNLIVEVIL